MRLRRRRTGRGEAPLLRSNGRRPKSLLPTPAPQAMLRPLTLLYFCVVSRSAVSFGFMTFLTLALSDPTELCGRGVT